MKRVVYLFGLSLLLGLVIVYLRTVHMQSVYKITTQRQEMLDIRQQIWQQQVQLSSTTESPQKIKQLLEQMRNSTTVNSDQCEQ